MVTPISPLIASERPLRPACVGKRQSTRSKRHWDSTTAGTTPTIPRTSFPPTKKSLLIPMCREICIATFHPLAIRTAVSTCMPLSVHGIPWRISRLKPTVADSRASSIMQVQSSMTERVRAQKMNRVKPPTGILATAPLPLPITRPIPFLAPAHIG